MSSDHALEGMCEGPELSTVVAFCGCGATVEGSDETEAVTVHAAHRNQPPQRSQEARSMNTNTEREDSATLIADLVDKLAPRLHSGDAPLLWGDMTAIQKFRTKEAILSWCNLIVPEILAAGYRKPRTITTVEELDALPVDSVALDADGVACQQMKLEGLWESGGEIVPSREIALPATVLFTPEPTK